MGEDPGRCEQCRRVSFFYKSFYQCYLIYGRADGSVAFLRVCDGFSSFCSRFNTAEEELWCFLVLFFLHQSGLLEIFSPNTVEQIQM